MSEDKQLKDFSQGDSEARAGDPLSRPASKLLSDETNEPTSQKSIAENEPESGKSPSSKCSKENATTAESMDNMKQNISHISIANLLQESKSLLNFENNLGRGPLTASTLTSTATIFDLCCADRQRVGQLIEELALAQGKILDLEDQATHQTKQEEKYKVKYNSLMKKVDVGSEKCRRLEDELSQMKEKHVESLAVLRDKVANISSQFETSAQEIHRLSKANIQLKMDNHKMQSKLSLTEMKLKAAEGESRESTMKYEALQRELQVKTQLRKTTKDTEIQIRRNSKETDLKTAEINLNNPKHPNSQCSSIGNYKDTCPFILTETIQSSPNSGWQSSIQHQSCKEEAILKDLFFRF